MRESLHRRLGGVAGAALDPADVSLRYAGQAGKRALRGSGGGQAERPCV
jgi:hypothetical protein